MSIFFLLWQIYARSAKKDDCIFDQLILSLSLDNLDSFWAKSEKLRSADRQLKKCYDVVTDCTQLVGSETLAWNRGGK